MTDPRALPDNPPPQAASGPIALGAGAVGGLLPQVSAPWRGRRQALLWVTLAVAVVLGAYLAYDQFIASRYETTDNAYVQGNLVQITPQIGGTVVAVLADDTDVVPVGQPLVRLDPADAQVALQQAEAALGQAVRQVRSVYANTSALSAQVTQRQVELTRLPAEERTARAAAEAALTAAREQLASQQTLTDGTRLEEHPGVQAAAARVREAWLATQRLVLPAPVAGHVARRTVQVGQRVAAGTPLMTIIPLDQLWVDANFKEVQLRKLRIGQPVRLTADLYGRQVTYRGTVAGLGAGTGAAFALLPAQNATGNWIKVVQRVPVRIALDPQDLAAHPLRVGLSMHVEVDVTRQEGQRLEVQASRPRDQAAQVLAVDMAGADTLVRKVIAANLGGSAPVRAAAAAPVTPVAPAASATRGASAASVAP